MLLLVDADRYGVVGYVCSPSSSDGGCADELAPGLRSRSKALPRAPRREALTRLFWSCPKGIELCDRMGGVGACPARRVVNIGD
jgi:hypothetical protein